MSKKFSNPFNQRKSCRFGLGEGVGGFIEKVELHLPRIIMANQQKSTAPLSDHVTPMSDHVTMSTWSTPLDRPKMKFRLIFLFMVHCVWFIVYCHRFNLSMAIIAMSPESASESAIMDDVIRGGEGNSSGIVPSPSPYIFFWSEKTKGNILAAFSFGYLLMQFPGGCLTDRFSSKHIVTAVLFFSSVFTAATPILASWSPNALIIVRLLIGVAQGPAISAILSMIPKWCQQSDLSLYNNIYFSGEGTAVIFTSFIGTLLFEVDLLGGWPCLFYLHAVMGILVMCCWHWLIYNSPKEHPHISEEERALLRQTKTVASRPKKTPWRQLIFSPASIAIHFGIFGMQWVQITLFTGLPMFYQNVFDMNMEEEGLFTALPFVFSMMFSNAGSWVVDKIIDRGCMSVSNTRKTVYAVTTMVTVLCFVAATYAQVHQIILVVVCMSLAGGFSEILRSAIFVNITDVAPNFSGILCGVGQTLGMGGQFLEPMVMGIVTSNDTSRYGYRKMFLITTGVGGFCALMFVLLGKGKQQNWDKNEEEVFHGAVDERSPLIGSSQ